MPVTSKTAEEVKLDFYKRQFPGSAVISIGLGDSYNDYDFLSITDISIIIRNNGRILRSVKKTGL